MAVVINDFEVVAEPSRQAEDAAPPASSGAAGAQASSPRDIERIVRRFSERLARVRAH